jgi:hypothetical protein
MVDNLMISWDEIAKGKQLGAGGQGRVVKGRWRVRARLADTRRYVGMHVRLSMLFNILCSMASSMYVFCHVRDVTSVIIHVSQTFTHGGARNTIGTSVLRWLYGHISTVVFVFVSAPIAWPAV